MKKSTVITLSIVEISLMILLVVFDVLLPSLLIIIVGFGFLFTRKEKTDIFNKDVWSKPIRFILCTAGLGFALSIFDFALVIPVVNHLTLTTQDMSAYTNLKGNTEMLMFFLAYSWIIAAIGEEIAYRGFFEHRISYRYKSIWASKLVHGFSNMIGLVTFYFTGPIYGLW